MSFTGSGSNTDKQKRVTKSICVKLVNVDSCRVFESAFSRTKDIENVVCRSKTAGQVSGRDEIGDCRLETKSMRKLIQATASALAETSAFEPQFCHMSSWACILRSEKRHDARLSENQLGESSRHAR